MRTFPPKIKFYGLVAQLVRALACHARGRGFEPHPSRHLLLNISADLAHLVERHLAKVEVAGSSPVIRSKHSLKSGCFSFCADKGHKPANNLEVIGSSPVEPHSHYASR